MLVLCFQLDVFQEITVDIAGEQGGHDQVEECRHGQGGVSRVSISEQGDDKGQNLRVDIDYESWNVDRENDNGGCDNTEQQHTETDGDGQIVCEIDIGNYWAPGDANQQASGEIGMQPFFAVILFGLAFSGQPQGETQAGRGI